MREAAEEVTTAAEMTAASVAATSAEAAKSANSAQDPGKGGDPLLDTAEAGEGGPDGGGLRLSLGAPSTLKDTMRKVSSLGHSSLHDDMEVNNLAK